MEKLIYLPWWATLLIAIVIGAGLAFGSYKYAKFLIKEIDEQENKNNGSSNGSTK